MITPSAPGFGWHRDSPDPRDYTSADDRVRLLLEPLKRLRPGRAGKPARVDWSEYLPPPDHQGRSAGCTAIACVTLARHFECRSTGRPLDASWAFLYKMARLLLRWQGDNGAKLRPTLTAMVRFGIPPEDFSEFDPERIDDSAEPHLFCYRDPFATIRYVRLDPIGSTGAATLATVKGFLAAGFPCVFGVVAFSSITNEPDIPLPNIHDIPRGGQALVAVGYDDAHRHRSTRGALRVRSTWGDAWGENGSGWLPYAYVERQLAVDFWTLLKPEWLDSGEFFNPLI